MVPGREPDAYSDKRGSTWYLTLTNPVPVKIDTATYGSEEAPDAAASLTWSPDSRWIAYTKDLTNMLHAVFVHSLAEGRSRQVTDGLGDAAFPVFADSGKYLLLRGQHGRGPDFGSWRPLGIEPTGDAKCIPRGLGSVAGFATGSGKRRREDGTRKGSRETRYRAEAGCSRQTRCGDHRGGPDHSTHNQCTARHNVTIDFEDLGQRILALPLPAKNYAGTRSRKIQRVVGLEGPLIRPSDDNQPPSLTVHRWDLSKTQGGEIPRGC